MLKTFTTVVAGAALALGLAGQALAFDCTVAKKPATAGAVVLVVIDTGEEIPLKPNPGTEEQPHGGSLLSNLAT